MAHNVNDQEVLRASDTLPADGAGDTDTDTDIVRETRPVETVAAEPVRSAATRRAEREATMRARYGGIYWGSDFIGFAVATFFTIVFLAIVGAIIGAVGYQLNAPVPKIGGALGGTTESLGIGALAGSLLAVFLAYLIGGYTAGRMARFDGTINGFGVWLWTIIVAILAGIAGGIAGNRFNLASQIHLNIDRTTLTTAGVISIVVTLIVMLAGALLGGTLGARYHRRIDRDMETYS